MDGVEWAGGANDFCAVIVWLGGYGAANFCELGLEIASGADEREIEHVWNLDCDSLPCRVYYRACRTVHRGCRRVK